jgi:uncharacterized membrane protein YtjA (UPF0391 family)
MPVAAGDTQRGGALRLIGKGDQSNMLKWAIIFLVIAIVAAIFGFTGIAAAAAGIAKFLFFLFLALCVIFFILGVVAAKKIT